MKAFRNLVSVLIVLTIVVIVFTMFRTSQQQRNNRQSSTVDPNQTETRGQTEPSSNLSITDSTQGEISLARNFYFIFDGSGSMRDRPDYDCGGDQTFRRKIDGAKWAVAEFLKKVPNDVNLGLYVFDEHRFHASEREMVALGSNNLPAFLHAMNEIEAGGGTPLAEAIRFGTDALVRQREKQLGYGEFRLIVVTDGLADDIPQAAEYATQNAIPIYAIGLCIKEDHPLRQYAVSYRAADSFEDLAKALEATVAETEFYDAKTFEALAGQGMEEKQ